MKIGKLLAVVFTTALLLAPLSVAVSPVRAEGLDDIVVGEGEMYIYGNLVDDKGNPLESYDIDFYFVRKSDGYAESPLLSPETITDSSGSWDYMLSLANRRIEDWDLKVQANKLGKSTWQYVAMNQGTKQNVGLMIDTHETFIITIEDEGGAAAPAGVPFWFSYVSPDQYNPNWPANAPLAGEYERQTGVGGVITFDSDTSGNIYPYGDRAYGGICQTGYYRYERVPEGTEGWSSSLTVDSPYTESHILFKVRALGRIIATAKDTATGGTVAGAQFSVPASGSTDSSNFYKYMYIDNGALNVYAYGDFAIGGVYCESDPHTGDVGYDLAPGADLTITPEPWGSVSVDIPFTRRAYGSIGGTVTAPDGNGDYIPVPGSRVELLWSWHDGEVGGIDDIDETTSDSAGNYSFTGVIPSKSNGHYLLRVTKDGYISVINFFDGYEVISGEALDIDATLEYQDTGAPVWRSGAQIYTYPESNSVYLRWPIPSDDTGVAGYRVYGKAASDEEFSLLGTVPFSKYNTYTAEGLSPDTAYDFKVDAFDGVGNVSAALTVSATTLPAPPDTGLTAAPQANPPGGAVAKGSQVVLSTSTVGAAIYYTTNGTTPTTDSTLYTTPITIDDDLTIKAIAVKDGMTDSEEMSATYIILEAQALLGNVSDMWGHTYNVKLQYRPAPAGPTSDYEYIVSCDGCSKSLKGASDFNSFFPVLLNARRTYNTDQTASQEYAAQAYQVITGSLPW